MITMNEWMQNTVRCGMWKHNWIREYRFMKKREGAQMRQKLLIVDDEKGIVDMMAEYFVAQ